MLREGKKQSTKRVSYIYEVHTIWEQKWYQISTEKAIQYRNIPKGIVFEKKYNSYAIPMNLKIPTASMPHLGPWTPAIGSTCSHTCKRQGCSAFNFKESNVQILGLLTAYYVETLHDPNQPCLTSKHLLLSRTKMMVILNKIKWSQL